VKRIGIEVSKAAAKAIALCDVDVIPAYPITPQTHIVEELAELVANGELDAEYIAVESEHSAISAAIGASAAGARTATSTASQGLALMHEILFIASGLRLPIVMVVANRALSVPINIWADHSDVMPERDTGWVQLFAENGQEVFDLIIQAFRLAEDRRVQLPVMVNLDGFSVSHVIEPITILEQDEVDAFLPPKSLERMLDPKAPRTIGAYGAQNVYTEMKMQGEAALMGAAPVMKEIWEDFSRRFGRSYHSVEQHAVDDAEVVLVTMGGISETAITAVDEMRAEGLKVGVARIRLWRPFPREELRRLLGDKKVLIVVDRMLSPGAGGGPVGAELRAAFYDLPHAPKIRDVVAGLGGREINRDTFHRLAEEAFGHAAETAPAYTLIDVRVQ